jgi:hypothetical protein
VFDELDGVTGWTRISALQAAVVADDDLLSGGGEIACLTVREIAI